MFIYLHNIYEKKMASSKGFVSVWQQKSDLQTQERYIKNVKYLGIQERFVFFLWPTKQLSHPILLAFVGHCSV